MFELTTGADLGVQDAVLKVLHYYSLFNYPLKINEVHGSCSQACSLSLIKEALTTLEKNKDIYSYREYYSMQNNISDLVERREKGNKLALEKEKSARLSGKIISWFPFVKFVGISGSLSKGCVTESDDFDFFIITEKNRLWIAYILLHLFKKFTFIFGKQHSFCMNYFIDTANLLIDQKNIFIAIELASLVPLHGTKIYDQLMSVNKWTNNFLPNNYVKFKKTDIIADNKNFIKIIFESLFNILWPEKLNVQLMKMIDARRRKKWNKKNYLPENYKLAYNTSLHISRNHRADRQKKIMKTLAEAGFE